MQSISYSLASNELNLSRDNGRIALTPDGTCMPRFCDFDVQPIQGDKHFD